MSEPQIFTPDEGAELVNTQDVRKRLIKNLAAEDVNVMSLSGPDKILLLGLLDGSDRSTFTRAKLRNDKQRDENNADVVKLVAETLKSINTKTYRAPASSAEREIPSSIPKPDFKPGETDIGNTPLTPEQVMGED